MQNSDEVALRAEILKVLLDEYATSEELYVDTKAKFLIDDIEQLLTSHTNKILAEIEAELPEEISIEETVDRNLGGWNYILEQVKAILKKYKETTNNE